MIAEVQEKKVSKKVIAQVLRKARDLMNNQGEHWVKGSYKCEIKVTKFHKDGSVVVDRYGRPVKECVGYQYCAVGAIAEAAEGDQAAAYAAMQALVDKGLIPEGQITKTSIRQLKRNAQEDAECIEYAIERGVVIDLDSPDGGVGSGETVIEGVITSWNDNPRRKWSDITGTFTRAARALR